MTQPESMGETIPEDVIDAMCLTWRHDFGLEAAAGPWGITSGMTDQERNGLRLQMRQLYQHHVLPAILAERERCAKIAEQFAAHAASKVTRVVEDAIQYGAAEDAANEIAATIRKPTP